MSVYTFTFFLKKTWYKLTFLDKYDIISQVLKGDIDMDNNVVEEVLNGGVPVSTPIALGYSDLYNLCTNKNKFSKMVDQEFKKAWEFVFGKSKVGEIQLFQTMEVATDKDTLEKRICFSFSGIISSIYVNLNIDDMYYKVITNKQNEYVILDNNYFSGFDDKIKKRTKCLKNITKEKKLKREFPALYQIYSAKEKQAEEFRKISKMLGYPEKYNMTELQARKLVFELLRKQNVNVNLDEEIRKSENFSLESFCNDCAEAFDYVSERLPEIENYLINHPIDISSFSKFDREKLELYVTNQFLVIAEKVPIEEKQRFLYHITNYFLSDENRKTNSDIKVTCGKVDNEQLEVSLEGYEITPKDLYNRYKNLLKNNPTLHAIDFRNIDFSDMNLSEVEEYMDEFLKELSANWEFIPKENNDIEKRVLESIRTSSSKIATKEEKQLHQEQLLDLYMAKKEFYDSTDPFFRIKGKNTFDGYVGYIYPNGKVILEKYYENSSTGRLAYGEAGYTMNIAEFYRLSRLSKLELMSMDSNSCDRIIHRGNWQSKAQSIIDQPGNFFETSKEVKKLIKTKNVEEV